MSHFLLLEARFYTHIADALMEGAIDALNKAGATFERISVPGVLEIPSALAMAVEATRLNHRRYDGYILLGCVIRGETGHYEIVAEKSAEAIYQLAIQHRLCIGNGILTVENEAQALVRARKNEKDKGGDAARAALRLVEIARSLARPAS